MLPKGTFPDTIFLNGELISSNEATISVFDRGFLFGDGIYEVMVQLENGLFYKDAHLERLQQNLEKIGIKYDVAEMESQLNPLLMANNLTNKSCLIYMQVTRGVAPRKHAYPKDVAPTVLMYALPYSLPHINTKSTYAILRSDNRWLRCDIKSTSLLGNVMANERAMEENADEAVLVRDGFITEGSHTNIFFVKSGKVYTHPANQLILDGITRKIVLKLCEELDIPLMEKAIGVDEIDGMDEAFLTGTTTQIASIAQLGEHSYHAPDAIGKTTQKLQQAFANLKKLEPSKLVL
ncbi:aminotransferase class IV [Muricauda sp. CAU 1633]|uniref:aminotransferase class IV n=1 Tax=Allomuricauda sp. CAU 1633 TaxID=2816036 RepID=UPI001A8D7063|nr:aminotransferase class IV [Muricauda sp. CAU 1633]MBO0323601.1 aminotransferase class IV [Muricauda sp. CAU 1633]